MSSQGSKRLAPTSSVACRGFGISYAENFSTSFWTRTVPPPPTPPRRQLVSRRRIRTVSAKAVAAAARRRVSTLYRRRSTTLRATAGTPPLSGAKRARTSTRPPHAGVRCVSATPQCSVPALSASCAVGHPRPPQLSRGSTRCGEKPRLTAVMLAPRRGPWRRRAGRGTGAGRYSMTVSGSCAPSLRLDTTRAPLRARDVANFLPAHQRLLLRGKRTWWTRRP